MPTKHRHHKTFVVSGGSNRTRKKIEQEKRQYRGTPGYDMTAPAKKIFPTVLQALDIAETERVRPERLVDFIVLITKKPLSEVIEEMAALGEDV